MKSVLILHFLLKESRWTGSEPERRIPGACRAGLVLSGDHRMDDFKGALTENYIMQALVTAGIQPYYWTLQQNAELDFVFQDRQGNIIPLEAKSAEHVRAKSLGMFMKRYDCPYAIRVSARNFGFENGIQSIPLYALFCLMK